MHAPLPADESERLTALRSYGVHDTAGDEALCDIARLAALICGTPIAMVNFVDADRVWCKAGMGLKPGQVSRDLAFCAHTIMGTDAMIVPDTTADHRFADHPIVTGDHGIRFYAGVPLLTPGRRAVGTLCVADHRPRRLSAQQRQGLEALSRQVVSQLELRRHTTELAAAVEARQRAEETEHTESRLVRLLSAVAEAANEATSLEEAAQRCIEQVCALTGWPVGHLYMTAADGSGQLVPSSVWHLDDPERFSVFRGITEATVLSPGAGFVGQAAKRGVPVWYPDATAEPDFARGRHGVVLGIRAGLAFPIVVGAEVVGVLEFFATERVEPDHRLLEVMARVGIQLGRVVERSRSAAVLEETIERTRQIIEAAQDAFIAMDSSGVITGWNRRAADVFGWSQEEARGRLLADTVIPPRHRPAHERGVAHFLATGEGPLLHQRVETTGWHRDGREVPIELAIWPVASGGAWEFNAFVQEISERKRAEEALRRLSLVEDRERIAKELHDGVIQSLFAVGMSLSATAAANGDPETSRRIEGAVEELDRVIHEVRSSIFSLRWGTLSERRVAEAVRALSGDFQAKTGVVTVVELEDQATAGLDGRATEVLQLLREALWNAGRHADATTCRVSLQSRGDSIVIEIDDDGRGFDLAQARGRGDGLDNLHDRAGRLGGRLEIATAPGCGTTVRVVVPK